MPADVSTWYCIFTFLSLLCPLEFESIRHSRGAVAGDQGPETLDKPLGGMLKGAINDVETESNGMVDIPGDAGAPVR
jgi:hypothetical protein